MESIRADLVARFCGCFFPSVDCGVQEMKQTTGVTDRNSNNLPREAIRGFRYVADLNHTTHVKEDSCKALNSSRQLCEIIVRSVAVPIAFEARVKIVGEVDQIGRKGRKSRWNPHLRTVD